MKRILTQVALIKDKGIYLFVDYCSLMFGYRYSLKPPSNSLINDYVDNDFNELIKTDAADKEKIMENFSEKFKYLLQKMSTTKRWNTACRLLAKKLVHENVSVRKKMVGELMNSVLMMIHLKKAYTLHPVNHMFVIHHTKCLH